MALTVSDGISGRFEVAWQSNNALAVVEHQRFGHTGRHSASSRPRRRAEVSIQKGKAIHTVRSCMSTAVPRPGNAFGESKKIGQLFAASAAMAKFSRTVECRATWHVPARQHASGAECEGDSYLVFVRSALSRLLALPTCRSYHAVGGGTSEACAAQALRCLLRSVFSLLCACRLVGEAAFEQGYARIRRALFIRGAGRWDAQRTFFSCFSSPVFVGARRARRRGVRSEEAELWGFYVLHLSLFMCCLIASVHREIDSEDHGEV